MRARHVVISAGVLDRPKLADLPGLADFQGHAFHTSRWDYGYTGGSAEGAPMDRLADKRVAIIGTGGLSHETGEVFPQFREVQDPVDLPYTAAFVANDDHGYYHRPLGHRFDGEAGLMHAGRARQLREEFTQMWERARPVSEYRALGL